jgi:hypothetical protein
MVQLSATGCSCIAILCVSLLTFAPITLCVAFQRVIPNVSVYFVIDSVRKLLSRPSYIDPAIQTLLCHFWRILCRIHKGQSEAYHSPPSSAEVKNAWSYTSTPQYVIMVWCLFKHRGNFTRCRIHNRRERNVMQWKKVSDQAKKRGQFWGSIPSNENILCSDVWYALTSTEIADSFIHSFIHLPRKKRQLQDVPKNTDLSQLLSCPVETSYEYVRRFPEYGRFPNRSLAVLHICVS